MYFIIIWNMASIQQRSLRNFYAKGVYPVKLHLCARASLCWQSHRMPVAMLLSFWLRDNYNVLKTSFITQCSKRSSVIVGFCSADQFCQSYFALSWVPKNELLRIVAEGIFAVTEPTASKHWNAMDPLHSIHKKLSCHRENTIGG